MKDCSQRRKTMISKKPKKLTCNEVKEAGVWKKIYRNMRKLWMEKNKRNKSLCIRCSPKQTSLRKKFTEESFAYWLSLSIIFSIKIYTRLSNVKNKRWTVKCFSSSDTFYFCLLLELIPSAEKKLRNTLFSNRQP